MPSHNGIRTPAFAGVTSYKESDLQFTQHFFNAPDIEGNSHHRIAWLEWGAADNPDVLFCVHGLARNAHDFDFLARELEAHRCPDAGLPFDFAGGFVGYFGYELKQECGGQRQRHEHHDDGHTIVAQQQQAQEQQMAMAERAQKLAAGAKTLSETDVGGGQNALQAMLGAGG